MLGIIGEGYTLARAALISTPEGEKLALGRARELASRLGIDPKQANAFIEKVDDVLERTRREAEKAVKVHQTSDEAGRTAHAHEGTEEKGARAPL